MQGAPDTRGRVQGYSPSCKDDADNMVTSRVLLIPADASGFVAIGENLTVQGSRGNVFCVGDMATSAIHPRPKAGVYAVRQGPPLTENIRRFRPLVCPNWILTLLWLQLFNAIMRQTSLWRPLCSYRHSEDSAAAKHCLQCLRQQLHGMTHGQYI